MNNSLKPLVSPKISVVVPVHNAEETIKRCLHSLLKQSFEDIEVIVVDDASTDSTLSVVNKMAAYDARLKIISYKSNKTANQARKDGVLLATGEYLLFCDADDEFLPDSFNCLYKEMSVDPVDILHFGTKVVCHNNASKSDEQWLNAHLAPYYGVIYDSDLLEACLRNNKYGPTLWNKMYSMDIAKKAFLEVEDGSFPRGQDIYAFFLISFYAKSYRGVAGCSCYQYNLGLGQDGLKVLHFDKFERFCSFAKVIHAIKVFLCKQNVFEKYSDIWLRLRSRMVGDCVNKWFTKVPDNEKAQSLDLMYSTWPAWMITESVARRYWHHRLEFSRVLSKTSLYSVVVESVKTIALYYHKLVGGGVERVMMGLAKIYVEMGCKVIIISDVQGPSDFIELPEGVQRFVIPNFGINQANQYYKRAREWQKLINEQQIDIVVYNAWNTSQLLWDMLSVKAVGSAFYIHCHSIFSYRLRENSSYFAELPNIFANADAVICLSETDKCFWQRFNGNVYCVLNPIDNAIKKERSLNKKQKKNIVLWVGRISSEKHPEEALKVLTVLAKQIPDIMLKMIGAIDNPGLLRQMKEYISKNNLSQNVEVCGYHEDVLPYYEESSILLSTSEVEGFPLNLFEAKAMGLPIVLYDLPYLTISDGNKGMFPVSYGNYKEAAQRIVDLLNDDQLYVTASQESIMHYKELSKYNYKEKWNEIFRSALEKRQNCGMNDQESRMWEVLLSHYFHGVTKAAPDNAKALSVVKQTKCSHENHPGIIHKILKKIKGGVECYKENGLQYTICRGGYHIKKLLMSR